MHTGIRHLFAPKELADRPSGTPEVERAVEYAVFVEHSVDGFICRLAVDIAHRTAVKVAANAFAVAFHTQTCQMEFAYHCRQHVAAYEVEIVVRAV